MKKTTALYEILNFGKVEERKLRGCGKVHEAYQIEHAREVLHFALLKSIKRVRECLDLMTEYTIDESGVWEYDGFHFVADEFTRELLNEFKKKFSRN